MADPKNSELPRANGKIAPAVWGGEEFVVLQGTQDGKMYVVGNVTMDNLPSEYKVIGTVNIGNLPEIQKVTDAQVKTKLDLIEQHQQEMLDRMKEGFQSTSKTLVTLTEYADAEVVEAGGKVNIPINMQGASKLVVLVSFDGQWKGSVATINSLNASDGENNIFPDTFREVQKSKSFNYPQQIVVGYRVNEAGNFLEALDKARPFKETINFLFWNEDAVEGTLHIRAIKIWE